MAPGEGRGPPGRGPPAPGPPVPPGRGPAAPVGAPAPCAGRGPPGPPEPPGRGMPCDGANGLLPGRAAPPERPGRGMPCDGANGLLPGRALLVRGPGVAPGAAGADAAGATGAAGAAGAGAAGRGAPGRADAGAGLAAAGAAGAWLGAAGCGALGAAGAWAAGAAGADGAGADGAGAGAEGAGVAAAGFGAGLSAGFSAAGAVGNFSLTRRSTGDSMVEDADLTYSPIDFSWSSRSLLLIPRSRASSCTRVLATTLLLRVHPGREDLVYWFELIAECSSGAHRRLIPLSLVNCCSITPGGWPLGVLPRPARRPRPAVAGHGVRRGAPAPGPGSCAARAATLPCPGRHRVGRAPPGWCPGRRRRAPGWTSRPSSDNPRTCGPDPIRGSTQRRRSRMSGLVRVLDAVVGSSTRPSVYP